MNEFLTACPRNCYSTCSFKVLIEDNAIKEFLPFPGNRATPEGVCIKGLSYYERFSSKDRILHPLFKQGDKFVQISWNEAIIKIASELKGAVENYEAQSILQFTSSGMGGILNGMTTNFFKLLGGATITYGNMCWPAGLEATKLTLGENKHNAPWDLENAGLIVLWGKKLCRNQCAGNHTY